MMKKSTKIILAVSLALALLAAIAVAAIAGVVLFAWQRIDIPEKAEQREKAKIAGLEFAKNTDQNGCLNKGFSLKPPADSFDVSNVTFVEECLQAAAQVPDFCEGVPLIFNRDWFNDQCRVAGRDREACISTFIAKRNYCHMDLNK